MTHQHLLATCLVVFVGLAADARPQEKARPISDDVAKDARRAFQSEYRSKDEKVRLAAIDRLTACRHAVVAACLTRALKDRSRVVRVAAATRLGLQEPKHAVTPLTRALADRKNLEADGQVMVGVLEAFQKLRRSPPLSGLKRLFDKGSMEVQREVVRTMRYWRRPEAVEFLAKHLEVPQPGNVDSPTNPPGPYWKDKVTRWNFWINPLMESIYHLTGTEFESEKQAREWLKGGGKIISLEEGERLIRGS